MSHDFKPGDKVVCVNVDAMIACSASPVLNTVYTVKAKSTVDSMCIYLQETEGGWFAKRFVLFNDVHAKDRAAGMVPMSGTVKPEPVMEPVAFALPCGRSQAIDVSPTTWPASAFPAAAKKRGA